MIGYSLGRVGVKGWVVRHAPALDAAYKADGQLVRTVQCVFPSGEKYELMLCLLHAPGTKPLGADGGTHPPYHGRYGIFIACQSVAIQPPLEAVFDRMNMGSNSVKFRVEDA